MMQFKTQVTRRWTGHNRLIITSSHHVVGGKLQNMFKSVGEPMLDVGDAIVLRKLLDDFIQEEAK